MSCEDFPCCGHGDGGCGPSTYRRSSGSRGGYGRGEARRTPPKDGTTRANKYAGECARCGTHLEAERGVIIARDGRWNVQCRPSELVGFPTARMVGGCAGEADKWNASAAEARTEWATVTA